MAALLRNLVTLRFSIRSMLVVVTIGCVLIGWRANRLYQNQRAIDSLGKRGLIVQRFVWPARHHDLSFWGSVNVNEIVLWGADAPDEEYPREVPEIWGDISKLVPLNSIQINYAALPSRAQSKGWNRPSSATEVEFDRCKFHEDAFENAIAQFPKVKTLKILSLDSKAMSLDMRGLNCLSSCAYLEALDLYMDSIPANVIANIEGKHLRRLELHAAEPNHRIELSAEDVKTIVAMENFEELIIYGQPGFPVAALPQLRNSKRLNVLDIHLVNISEADLEAAQHDLAKWLPDCEVTLYRHPSP